MPGHDLYSALLLLAVLDSLNPSALLVALWLLSRPVGAAPRLLAYVGGILVAYLGLGIAMMLGLQAIHAPLAAWLDHPAAILAEAMIGAALLAYALFAPAHAHQAREPREPSNGRLVAFVILGMTVTAMELVTALPYFAAIALMTGAHLPVTQWLILLIGYNLIFIAPPLLLLAIHETLGRRADTRFSRWREQLRRGAREATLWIFGLIGVALLVDAANRW